MCTHICPAHLKGIVDVLQPKVVAIRASTICTIWGFEAKSRQNKEAELPIPLFAELPIQAKSGIDLADHFDAFSLELDLDRCQPPVPRQPLQQGPFLASGEGQTNSAVCGWVSGWCDRIATAHDDDDGDYAINITNWLRCFLCLRIAENHGKTTRRSPLTGRVKDCKT